LADLDKQGVLTVADEDCFLSACGVNHILNEDRKVRFEINLAAARKARLTISSKLLQLATSVREEAEGGK
ncbi:MAG: YfiR family protein, partial [Bryobacteraceae bacterium]